MNLIKLIFIRYINLLNSIDSFRVPLVHVKAHTGIQFKETAEALAKEVTAKSRVDISHFHPHT